MLPADLEELGEQRVVGRPGAVEELHPQRPARVAVTPVRRERHDVGVVGGQRDEAVLVDGVGVDPVLRHALELVGRDLDRADVVADVLAELLPDEDGPLRQLLDPGAGGVVLVDAAAVEVEQRLVQQPLRGGVQTGAVDGGEHLVEVAVEAQVGVELLDLLHRRLAARAHRLHGVDLAEQRRHRGDVADGDAHVVPPVQQVGGVGRAVRLDARRRARAPGPGRHGPGRRATPRRRRAWAGPGGSGSPSRRRC